MVNVKVVGDERISGQVSGYDVIYEAGLVKTVLAGLTSVRRDAPLRYRTS